MSLFLGNSISINSSQHHKCLKPPPLEDAHRFCGTEIQAECRRAILLLLSVSTEITQGYSAGEQASLKGSIWVPLTCPVPGLAQIRTAKCSAYMWPLHVVWPPDNTETSKRSDFTHSGSGPQAQTLLLIRWKLSCLLWPSLRSHTALFASCSISQNRHKPIQIQGDENYTPTIERVTKSHTVCKSTWDKRYCCDHLLGNHQNLLLHWPIPFSLNSCSVKSILFKNV